MLQLDELKRLLLLCGFELSATEIEDFVREADTNGDGVIAYSELVPVAMKMLQSATATAILPIQDRSCDIKPDSQDAIDDKFEKRWNVAQRVGARLYAIGKSERPVIQAQSKAEEKMSKEEKRRQLLKKRRAQLRTDEQRKQTVQMAEEQQRRKLQEELQRPKVQEEQPNQKEKSMRVEELKRPGDQVGQQDNADWSLIARCAMSQRGQEQLRAAEQQRHQEQRNEHDKQQRKQDEVQSILDEEQRRVHEEREEQQMQEEREYHEACMQRVKIDEQRDRQRIIEVDSPTEEVAVAPHTSRHVSFRVAPAARPAGTPDPALVTFEKEFRLAQAGRMIAGQSPTRQRPGAVDPHAHDQHMMDEVGHTR